MKISVLSRGEEIQLQVNQGPKLLEHLQDKDIHVNAACGGKGSCHKCRIQVLAGFSGVTEIDRKAFSEEELKKGWRLSCQALPRTSLRIRVPDVESLKAKARVIRSTSVSTEALSFACDLGSTGIVVAIGNASSEVLLEAHLLNRQVRFGADIMTRLKFAQEKGTDPLREELLKSLKLCFEALEAEAPEVFARALTKELYCSGNSAMVSFLQGYDVSQLAVYPFQPLQRRRADFHSEALGCRIVTLPLLGGFVGADTFAGILHLESQLEAAGEASSPWIFVDIGTNTEIVIRNEKNELWFSSAPAGPAFEGGNILCGMRAEPGAISRARFMGHWDLETIGRDRPRGICGSGLMDIISEALKAGLMEKDGLLREGKIQLTEEISLTADDVREFQLAKGATRTALDLLMHRAGLAKAKIYLAGTFAEHIQPEALFSTGLLPAAFDVEFLGNASLKGSLKYAADEESVRRRWERAIEARLKPVELALQDDFQELFVKNLNF